ncbi:MAG: putative monovalent cation/H+ antiporter subunit A [Puniceicoccales bacterium]
MLILLSILTIFVGAALAPFLGRRGRAGWSLFLGLPPLIAFILLAVAWFGTGLSEGEVVASWEWFPSLGVSLDFRLDGLSVMMGLLVTGIGVLVGIYAAGYMKGHPQFGRFGSFLLLFMGAMLGLVLSDNLILLFVFWELTSISSYLLIGFNHEDENARKKALQALLVTGGGAVAMLGGFILLGNVAGTYRISELGGLSAILHESPLYTGMVILILLGAFTKSAQVPFHFWLPNAMAAPTPVSAYLHSATMVKAGVFLLARLNPALGEAPLWSWSLTCFGGATLLTAVVLGLFQTDLKKILAYTTLGVLGMLTMLIGLGTELAIKSMIVFLVGHALYKAALFMTAGSVDHETGTRDVRVLRGLRKAMPITAVAAGLAALSKAGFPPFFGFVGKEYVYKAGVAMEGVAEVALPVAFAGNLLMLALAFKAGVSPFWGKPSAPGLLPKPPHEAPPSMWIGPLLLAVLGLVFGLFPSLVSSSIVGPAVSAVEGQLVELHISLWHGINLPLILSICTLAGGITLYSCRRFLWNVHLPVNRFLRSIGAEAVYDRLFDGMVKFSKVQTRFLQSGLLHNYVFVIVSVTTALLAWALFTFGGVQLNFNAESLGILSTAIVVVMIIAAILAAVTSNRITALVALGTVGFGVALLFLYYGAPDLAITQLLVETLTVVLFMFVIFRLPRLRNLSSRGTRLRDGILAAFFGSMISLLVLKAFAIQFHESIAIDLAEMSYPEAKGKNVVNVILVDFRALDTLGEITVLSIAALGVAALVAGKARKKGKAAGQ